MVCSVFTDCSSVWLSFYRFFSILISSNCSFPSFLEFLPFVRDSARFHQRIFKNHHYSSKFFKKLQEMKTTRQSSTRAESDDMTMQQVMDMMQGLQEAMAASKVEQERIQADLAASQARNEELCRVNEELRRGLRNHPGSREAEDRECFTPPREFSTPFSQSIMEAVIPHTSVGPMVTFTGMENPEAHLNVFHTQMMLVGGSDAVRCKIFMSTLTGMAMDWFISLLDGHITSFA